MEWMSDHVPTLMVGLLLGFFCAVTMSSFSSARIQREAKQEWREEAAQNGHGAFVIDPVTGKTEFQWKSAEQENE